MTGRSPGNLGGAAAGRARLAPPAGAIAALVPAPVAGVAVGGPVVGAVGAAVGVRLALLLVRSWAAAAPHPINSGVIKRVGGPDVTTFGFNTYSDHHIEEK